MIYFQIKMQINANSLTFFFLLMKEETYNVARKEM